MTKEFVSYEQAVALKELGFNEECFKFYYKKNKKLSKSYEECTNFWSDSELIEQGWEQDEINEKRKSGEKFECCVGITAPLYQQAFRWFREKYDLQGYVYSTTVRGKKDGDRHFSDYCWNINGIDKPFISTDPRDMENISYEEAEQACLEQLIQIVNDQRRSS